MCKTKSPLLEVMKIFRLTVTNTDRVPTGHVFIHICEFIIEL